MKKKFQSNPNYIIVYSINMSSCSTIQKVDFKFFLCYLAGVLPKLAILRVVSAAKTREKKGGGEKEK